MGLLCVCAVPTAIYWVLVALVWLPASDGAFFPKYADGSPTDRRALILLSVGIATVTFVLLLVDWRLG
jgi:hypothetical protein